MIKQQSAPCKTYHGLEFIVLFVYAFNVENINFIDLGLIKVQEEVLSMTHVSTANQKDHPVMTYPVNTHQYLSQASLLFESFLRIKNPFLV